jgi:hypothetical protein
MKKIWKNQKPIDIDAHFKYRCPDKDCGYDHWISLKQSQTKKFKIVCDCGTVFIPKRISKIKVLYESVESSSNKQPTEKNISVEIPVETLDSCVNLLTGYGFTKSEAIDLIKNAYIKCENKESSNLIKFALQNLENFNVT